MSDTGFYLSLGLVVFTAFALIGYIIIGTFNNRKKQAKGGYQWKPEQDYDVVMRGETPMSPGFPTLVKREKEQTESNEQKQ